MQATRRFTTNGKSTKRQIIYKTEVYYAKKRQQRCIYRVAR